MSKKGISLSALCDMFPLEKYISYSLQSVPVESLFISHSSSCEGSESPTPHDFVLHHIWKDKDLACGMGCINVGSRLYFFGGQLPVDDQEPPWVYTRENLSCEVCRYDLSDIVKSHLLSTASSYVTDIHPSSPPPAQMSAGKSYSIVVEVDGLIYVLTGSDLVHHCVPDPTFEVYDPCTNKWTSLEAPPFLCEYHQCFFEWNDYPFPHAVIDKKICVSSVLCSFAFDTRTRKWMTCELFTDFDPSSVLLIEYPRHSRHSASRKRYRSVDVMCDPPFAFSGRALLYGEDILLGYVPSQLPLVAYQVVQGKVKRMQCLSLGADCPDCDGLVDLGGGYFCFMYHTLDRVEMTSDLTLVTFKLSRIDEVVVQGLCAEFLKCDVVSRSTRKIDWEYACFPIHAFVM
ncbi:hypothetical protein ACH5RR_022128 [Cinchona calisaya]|uniref:Uncharacterized protein n=1 Tax=Cinchona calisaya TaxID=153742 RepID=A0ABD2Z6X0_9GENT